MRRSQVYGTPEYRLEILRQRIFGSKYGLKIAVAISKLAEKHPNSRVMSALVSATIPF